MKIIVRPEGRPECYLPERDSLKAWIAAQGFESIHNMGVAGPVAIGADHSVDGVLADIDEADRVAVLLGDARRGNFNHALALVMPPRDLGEGRSLPERLEMYDLGDITEDDLEVER